MSAPLRHGDPRVPDPPSDIFDGLDDPTLLGVAAAFWRIGYTACLNDRAAAASPSWRDAIPAGVRILDDFDSGDPRREG